MELPRPGLPVHCCWSCLVSACSLPEPPLILWESPFPYANQRQSELVIIFTRTLIGGKNTPFSNLKWNFSFSQCPCYLLQLVATPDFIAGDGPMLALGALPSSHLASLCSQPLMAWFVQVWIADHNSICRCFSVCWIIYKILGLLPSALEFKASYWMLCVVKGQPK